MNTLDSMLERNKGLAAHQSATSTLMPSLPRALPNVRAIIIGCADMRVDPAHVLGIKPPRSETSGFEMDSIAEHNGPAEREPRLRAVPLHEFFNGVPVTALRVCRGQAVQNGRFCLIQIG